MLKKEKIYFFLNNSGLQIISKRQQYNQRIDFAEEHLLHQEVIDINKYRKLLSDLIARLPNKEIVLLLAEELVYKKNLKSLDQADFHKERESFLNMIPFDEDKISHTHVVSTDKIELLAVNKDLYEPILAIASEQNKKIKHVVPISILSEDSQNEPTYSKLNKFYSQSHFKKYDLSSAGNGIIRSFKAYEYEELGKIDEEKPLNKRLFGGLVLLFLLFLVLINLFISQKKHHNPVEPKTMIQQAIVPTNTPEPTRFYKAVSDLKIRVLNGSNLSGQASKLKNYLTKLGFAKIEIDNYENNDAKDIKVFFSALVSPDNSKLIINELESFFPDLLLQQSATSEAEFDAIIIIGNRSL